MSSEQRLKSIRNWIAGSEYDLTTAKHMLDTGRYIYVIFMCHLSLEKIFKAHVEFHEDKMPPRIHDLITLLDRSGLDIPGKLKNILLELNGVSIPTRYPEDIQPICRNSEKIFAREFLSRRRRPWNG
jgi:HEPN domain-containing protein